VWSNQDTPIATSRQLGKNILTLLATPSASKPSGRHIAEPKETEDKIGRLLSEEKLLMLHYAIKKFLAEKKPFVRQKYSLRDLSVDVNIPTNYLSDLHQPLL